MRYDIPIAQINFFIQYQFIEFEDLFNSKDVEALIASIAEKPTFDLWRSNEIIRKFLTKKSISEIGFQLTSRKPIRLLMDKILLSGENKPISELVPFNEIAFALIICIDPKAHAPKSPLPQQEGNILFADKELLLPLETLEGTFLLAVYGYENTQFVPLDNNDLSTQLKKQGYAPGDALKQEDFPYTYR